MCAIVVLEQARLFSKEVGAGMFKTRSIERM